MPLSQRQLTHVEGGHWGRLEKVFSIALVTRGSFEIPADFLLFNFNFMAPAFIREQDLKQEDIL